MPPIPLCDRSWLVAAVLNGWVGLGGRSMARASTANMHYTLHFIQCHQCHQYHRITAACWRDVAALNGWVEVGGRAMTSASTANMYYMLRCTSIKCHCILTTACWLCGVAALNGWVGVGGRATTNRARRACMHQCMHDKLRFMCDTSADNCWLVL
jgi:hypothetical protein